MVLQIHYLHLHIWEGQTSTEQAELLMENTISELFVVHYIY